MRDTGDRYGKERLHGAACLMENRGPMGEDGVC